MSDQNPYGSPSDPSQQNPYGGQQWGPGAGTPGQPGLPGQPEYGQQQAGGYGYPGGYAQPGGYPQGAYAADPNAPYGYDVHGRPYSSKTKLIAGLLQILVGGVGAGRWYTGHYGLAIAQLLTCGGLGIWALIDGIYLLASDGVTDSDGRVLRSS
ncbi:TM2 domain-containing protein [Streptomyces sp. ST2-7A]|uniref:TM2 domain-containing protein n=1 Tax=Streptomyces sp. ST2-7A TaxID=2907214 RepID=UPI001F36AC64|nr:TM2 domain-containing protein [Streptomyces sp. ST2-7A]MCE7080094.1 TM2 domain-containing protein [Streptomyces sp. ST2-7A]